MAKKQVTGETRSILSRLDSGFLLELQSLSMDDKKLKTLLSLLEILKNVELQTILKTAGISDSLDAIIKNTGTHSFSKGRISMAQLTRSILENVETEINTRDIKKDKPNKE